MLISYKKIVVINILVLIIYVAIISCTSQKKASTIKNCPCSKVLKAYIYIESNYKDDSFGPRRPVVFYFDGTKTSPPIDRHINTVLLCTDVKLYPPSDQLIYHISEKNVEDLKNWLQINCPKEYNKYFGDSISNKK